MVRFRAIRVGDYAHEKSVRVGLRLASVRSDVSGKRYARQRDKRDGNIGKLISWPIGPVDQRVPSWMRIGEHG